MDGGPQCPAQLQQHRWLIKITAFAYCVSAKSSFLYSKRGLPSGSPAHG